MGDPYLGEIKLFSFDWAPRGWAMCNGQLLPINQNQALFSLLGTTYGGDGRTTFALPDFRSRVPRHFLPNTYPLGAAGGEAAHTLTVAELADHVHPAQGTSDPATVATPGGNLLAAVDPTTFGSAYQGGSNLVAMAPQALTNAGGSQPHENRQPYLCLNFCIALVGVFPSQN